MVLKLQASHLQTIRAHAERMYPDECCGIMVGQLSNDDKTLIEVWETENVWNAESESYEGNCLELIANAKPPSSERSGAEVFLNPASRIMSTPDSEQTKNRKRRYAIAPAMLLQAQRIARDRHLDIIGIYHSHPDSRAVPSELDRLYAWHRYLYIIVSVQQGKVDDLLCWSLDDNNRFQPEEILAC
ncbi:MAG: M67 family metallopeptidase [Chroococcidiopsidaceae cyanobacterium CP_BM_RX_35]|nr:M67 family metallopeptidase [Chroococcidiopsidaceae cyanobacterium CP_BM_RX_35]